MSLHSYRCLLVVTAVLLYTLYGKLAVCTDRHPTRVSFGSPRAGPQSKSRKSFFLQAVSTTQFALSAFELVPVVALCFC